MNLLDDVLLRRTFWLCLSLLLLIRIALALWLPLTDEELHLIGRVYSADRASYPPLLNAWLSLALGFSPHPLLLRLPQVLMPMVVGFWIRQLFKDENETLSYATAIAWMSLPPQVIDIVISTNTPLLCFAFFSIAFFYRGVRDEDHGKQVWSGLFLGFALLSDPFASLLGLAYLVFIFVSPRREHRGIDVAIVAACAASLLLIFLIWSPLHDWAAWPANFFHLGQSLSWTNTLLFIAAGLLAAGPFLMWQLGRARNLRRVLCNKPGARALWTLAVVPIGALSLFSILGTTELGELSAFVPALVLVAALLLGRDALLRSARWMSLFTLLLLTGLAFLAPYLDAHGTCYLFEPSRCSGSE